MRSDERAQAPEPLTLLLKGEVEVEGRRYELHPVDPVKNSRRKRPPRRPRAEARAAHPAFDPPRALLDKALRRKPSRVGGDA